MDIHNYEELSDMHIDVLTEIGNIGAGNTATSLSQLLEQSVDISVPKVKILSFDETIQALGGPEKICVGIFTQISGDIKGFMMFILEQEFSHLALNVLMGKNITSYKQMTEMDYSAVSEIGNIMSASYICAISSLTGMDIQISIPSVSIDMLGSIMSVPVIEFGKIGDKVLFIEGDFVGSSQNITSRIILIPDMESLNKIMKSLGISS